MTKTFHILHTEASPGFGGQEMRILNEARGMRERGHFVIFAIQKGGELITPLKKEGFLVYELDYTKFKALFCFAKLCYIVLKHKIKLINTHSSLDAWIGGCVGRLLGKKIIRTRHLSTPIRGGLNSFLLYNILASSVVTTCKEVAILLRKQARLSKRRCRSVPTGVETQCVVTDKTKIANFRKHLGIDPDDFLVGTCCILRGWKGIGDLLQAAKTLENEPHLKWIVIGGGVSEAHFKQQQKALGLEGKVFFVGCQSPPYTAIAALDIFVLLSWAHEGVSQASLQAAYLRRPLITTTTGGLPEVCLPGKTGLLVEPHSPKQVAEAVKTLLGAGSIREQMGREAKRLVETRFTLECTLDKMEEMYHL